MALMKRFMAYVLVCALLLGSVPVSAAREASMGTGRSEPEVVYISTVQELAAIDGEVDKYFELTADIDLSGYAWKPIQLTGCTFNGAGHTIRNASVKQLWEVSEDGGEVCAAFFSFARNTFVTEVNFENLNVDVEIESENKGGRLWNIGSVLAYPGVGAVDHCTISGSIAVSDSGEAGHRITVYGLSDAVSCESRLNIEVSGGGSAYGIYDSVNSDGYGSVTVNGGWASGMEDCEGCTYEGDIVSDFRANGIVDGKNCSMEGDVRAEGESSMAYGVSGTDSQLTGTVSAKGEIDSGAWGIYCFNGRDSKNCRILGDVIAESSGGGTKAYGISGDEAEWEGVVAAKCSEGYMEGTVSASTINGYAEAYGIYGKCYDCYREGDVTADASNGLASAYGGRMRDYTKDENSEDRRANGENNFNAGNVTAKSDGESEDAIIRADAYGFRGGVNNYNEGRVSAEGSGSVLACGLYGTKDSYSFGHIKALERGEGTYVYEVASVGCFASSNGYAEGDIYAESAHGYRDIHAVDIVQDLAGSYFTGTLTAVGLGGYTLSATKEGEGKSVYMYQSWETDEWYFNENNLYRPPLSGSSSTFGSINAIYGTSSAKPPQKEWTPGEGEEEGKDTYSICVMDRRTDKPAAGAVIELDGVSYATDENGVAVVTGKKYIKGLKVLRGGSIVHTETDYFIVPGQTNYLYINGLNLTKDDINLGGSGDFTLEGPVLNLGGTKINLFALPFGFEMNFFNALQVAYDEEKRIYQVMIGAFDIDDEAKDKEKDANSPVWKRPYNQIKRLIGKKEGDLIEATNDLSKFKELNNKKFGPAGASVHPYGYVEFAVTDAGLELKEGGLLVKVGGEVSGSAPLPPPVPYIYLSFGISANLDLQAIFVLEKASFIDPEISTNTTAGLTFTPYLGIGLGWNKVLSAEAGLEGPINGTLQLPFQSPEESFQASFTGKAYVQVVGLAFSRRASKQFVEVPLFPKKGEKPSARSADIGDLEGAKLIDRSYQSQGERTSRSSNSFREMVYPYGGVQAVQLSDGRTLLVWLDDDSSRNLINKTALYYSILDDGKWSEPAQIANDGTADFEFGLSVSGASAAIVWQNANQQLEESASQEELAESMEISCAYFDGSVWSKPVNLTAPEAKEYEYHPRIYCESRGKIYVSWTKNDKNSIVPGTDGTVETICRAQLTSQTLEEYAKNKALPAADTVFEGLPLVYETAIGENGVVAYIGDKDGDAQTVEDMVFCSSSGTVYDKDTQLTNLQCLSDDGSFYFFEKGRVMCSEYYNTSVKAWASAPENSKTVKILWDRNNGRKAVVYEVEDGFSSNLYASYQLNGKWTHPVPITDYEEKIRSFSVALDTDGNIRLGAVLAQVSVGEEENDVTDSARLVWETAEPIEDLTVEALYTKEETISRGQKAVFCLNVANNTQDILEDLDVRLSGEEAGVLFEGSVEAKIRAGETKNVEVSVTLPEDFTLQTVTAEVTSPDVNEKDLSNNKRAGVFGYANLTANIKGDSILTEGYAQVEITNDGCADAQSVVLEVSDNNGNPIYEESTEVIPAGKTIVYQIPIEEAYRSFEDEWDSHIIMAKASAQNEESCVSDNEAGFKIEPPTVKRISLEETDITLKPGESYMPSIQTYPANAVNPKLYAVSDNTEILSVNEEGRITANARGTATVTYMSLSKARCATLTVRVQDEEESGNKHTITLDANGGALEVSQIEVEDGKTAVLPTPVRDGYLFEGWFDREDGSLVTSGTVITGDKSLYAFWTPEEKPDPTPTPDPGPQPTPTPTPSPGSDTKPGENQTPGQSQNPGQNQPAVQVKLKKGAAFTRGNIKYRVTKAANSSGSAGQAQMVGTVNGSAKKTVIPPEVTANSTGEKFKVVSIAADAFRNNRRVTEVTIGKNVKTIGKNAFNGCKKLKKIKIKTKELKKVGNNAVKGIHKKAVLTVPSAKWKKYRSLFGKKSGFAKTMKIKK